VAGRIGMVQEAGIELRCLLGFFERDGRGRVVDVDVGSPGLRDHHLPLLELVPDEVEVDTERSGTPESHLEAAAERLGDEPAGVAAVGRVRRPVVARRDYHRASVRWMTPYGGRASVYTVT